MVCSIPKWYNIRNDATKNLLSICTNDYKKEGKFAAGALALHVDAPSLLPAVLYSLPIGLALASKNEV